MNKLHVRKDDMVVILSGKDKGKKGKVLETSPKEQKLIVEGVNMITKHVRPRSAQQQGGRVTQEGAFYASKAMLYCTKCNKPTRPAHKLLADGKKVCVCKKCGAEI